LIEIDGDVVCDTEDSSAVSFSPLLQDAARNAIINDVRIAFFIVSLFFEDISQ
jgi:hypothetical protein